MEHNPFSSMMEAWCRMKMDHVLDMQYDIRRALNRHAERMADTSDLIDRGMARSVEEMKSREQEWKELVDEHSIYSPFFKELLVGQARLLQVATEHESQLASMKERLEAINPLFFDSPVKPSVATSAFFAKLLNADEEHTSVGKRKKLEFADSPLRKGSSCSSLAE